MCIPYEIEGEVKPTYPDFIVVRTDKVLGYVIDLLEPHNPEYKDNLGKAKGFAEYARQNAGVGRIQLIRMGKDAAGNKRFKRLDMSKSAVRDKVSHATSNDELDRIFDTDGFLCNLGGDRMSENSLTRAANLSLVVQEIKSVLDDARRNVAVQVNNELLMSYWKMGEIIVRYEQDNSIRAAYGEQTLKQMSKALTQALGKGFSRSNLQNMRQFYLTYEKCQTLSGKLSWSHYCELLSISDPDKRSFYEKESINSNWSVRELRRQIASSLFERLLLSKGNVNKERVLALAQNGVEISKPEDIIRDPYVFEFVGIPEDKPMMESDLERALVQQIEKFILELGRGFMFVGTQQRVTLNNTHYYVDMVFYNKILRAYVLIELKTTKLTPEAAGQINMYLNYYASEVNDPDDNPPIGIILCTEKDSITAEYALGGLSNNIFASRYVLYMPNKEQLITQVENVIEKWHNKEQRNN